MTHVELPDPTAPPTKMDRLVYGIDCARHPIVGCIIGHGNGDPNEQARNYLRSIWGAAEISSIDGETDGDRQQRLANVQAEIRDWLRRLYEWEKTNSVAMPRRMTGHHVGR